MVEFFNSLDSSERLFLLCAVFGGVIFIMRMLLMIIGGIDDFDGIDIETDYDASIGDTDSSFALLSLHGITAFFMMFGLVALAISKQTSGNDLLSVPGGIAAGLGTVWIISWLLVSMKKLQSDGTINLSNSLGEEGTVYLTVNGKSGGKVQIAIQGGLKVMDAVSDEEEVIQTGERIRVVDITSGNMLVVERLDPITYN